MSDLKAHRRFAISKKSLGIAFAILLVTFALMYLARGWLRVTVAPAYVNLMHGQSVQKSFDEVNKELGHPLTAFELDAGDVRSNNAVCDENTAQYFYVEVGCGVFIGGKSKDIDAAYQQKHSVGLEGLENKLIQGGWQKSQSVDTPPTFKALLMSKETGYVGYVRYDKKVRGNSCWIDISRFEYLSGFLSCNRTSTVGISL